MSLLRGLRGAGRLAARPASAPPPTALGSCSLRCAASAGVFVPRRHKKWDLPFGRQVNANDVIEGEMEDGGISYLEGFGEPTPAAAFHGETTLGVWNKFSKRTGVVAQKVGMMNVWDARGVKTLLTVVKLADCQVTMIRRDWTPQGEKILNLQVGSGTRNPKTIKKATLMHFRKANVPPKARCAEFSVSEDAVLPVGTRVTARHFVPGQYVDIAGNTKGKGFQGGMKRWGMAGQPASHGNSLTHRHIGSTGACQDPGKVFKNKKMPGRMGNKRRTMLNYQIYKIDVARDLVFLRGSIPGPNGSWVEMSDARRKAKKWRVAPPYPTYVPDPNEEPVDELVMDVSYLTDPFVLQS